MSNELRQLIIGRSRSSDNVKKRKTHWKQKPTVENEKKIKIKTKMMNSNMDWHSGQRVIESGMSIYDNNISNWRHFQVLYYHSFFRICFSYSFISFWRKLDFELNFMKAVKLNISNRHRPYEIWNTWTTM